MDICMSREGDPVDEINTAYGGQPDEPGTPSPASRMVYGDLFAKAMMASHNPVNRIRPEHLALTMRKLDAVGPREVVHDGRRMLMLSSNNYLGLAGDPRLAEAGIDALRTWGSSTSGSRLLNGTNELHHELERRLRAFKQVESVVVFQSGYMANLGVISALTGKDDVVIVDKLVHASILDGCTLARTQVRTFRHQNLESLERVLESTGYKAGKLVVVDGVYSMDGDFAKLPEIIALAHRYGARVMVDDAHATGVAGPGGRGTADHFGIAEPDIITGTLSKAFGCVGGFVGARRDVMEYIQFNSRAFIYSTSLSPALTASLIRALDIIEAEPEKRANLWACTRRLLDGLKALGFDTGTSETPIVPVILADNDTMFDLVGRLDGDDIFASPVAYPACPKNQPRVRISLCSEHTLADMDRVLESFARHGRAMGLID